MSEKSRFIHERIPSRDIFFTEEELLGAAKEALTEGVVSVVEFKGSGKNGDYPDTAPRVALNIDDIDSNSWSEFERQSGKWGLKYEDVPAKDPESVLQKTKSEVEEQIVLQVARSNQWHLIEPSLEQDLSEGYVTQLFEITLEGREPVQVVNFSDSLLNEHQVQQIREVTDKVAELTAGAVFDATKAICILPSSRFRDRVLGSARGYSNVITLNESLVNGDVERRVRESGEEPKFSEHGLDFLESTLTHEYWHLIEFQDTEMSAYAASTGWKADERNIVDDYGNVEFVSREYLSYVPYQVMISDEDGKMHEIYTPDHYSEEVMRQAKPMTKYGYTNNREDSAEAFVPYVHASDDLDDALDPIRHNAISGILARIRSSREPVQTGSVAVKHQPLKAMKSISTRTYTLQEPQYNIQGVDAAGRRPDTQDTWYSDYSRRKIVDDYGEEQEVRAREPRNF